MGREGKVVVAQRYTDKYKQEKCSLLLVILIGSIAVFQGYYAEAIIRNLDCKMFSTVREISKSNSRLLFVTSAGGEKLIIKQLKTDPARAQRKAAREVLGAYIAGQAHVSCNPIAVLSSADPCRLKLYKEKPATVHGFVPGQPIALIKRFYGVTLQQPVKQVSAQQRGLTLKVIKNFALHAEFARLASIDTFLGNHDRHRANILYDEMSNKVFGIDFSCVFAAPLAEYAHTTITRLIKTRQLLSPFELAALVSYRDTLALLARKFPPAVMCQKYDEIVRQVVGYGPQRGKKRKGALSEMTSEDKHLFDRNYKAVLKLIKSLTTYITLHKVSPAAV